MTISEKIYKLRTELKLSQKDFANMIGTSQSAVNYWENGKRQPKIVHLKKIAQTFHISLTYFLDDASFDAATLCDPESESKVIRSKLKDIVNMPGIDIEKRNDMLEEYISDLQVLKTFHNDNREAGSRFLCKMLFEKLNSIGQEKAIEQLELLTKIPEYQRLSPEK